MYRILFFITLLLSLELWGQDDLLKEIDTIQSETYHNPAFKSLQIVGAQSTKLVAKGDLQFVVSHKFGSIDEGFKNFFGLDQATTKIGFIYGATDRVSLSIARYTYKKTYEFGAKYGIIAQNNNNPVNVVGFSILDINSELKKSVYPGLEFRDRVSHLHQLLISRRFTDKLSLQVTPSWINKRLIDPATEKEHQFSLGLGGRYKLSKRLSLNGEYFYNIDQPNVYKNPLSIGVDIETGGHVFQLMLSNSQPNSEIGYLTNALGDWSKGKIYFGFNLYRVF